MLSRIDQMGKQARSMISQAKQAFAERDVELARDLVRQDDVVDDLNRECFQLALEIGDDTDTREWAMTMMLVARALERIGDNAVDIGEQVAFVVTGLFREFEDASHPEAGAASGELRTPPGTALPARLAHPCVLGMMLEDASNALRRDRHRLQHDPRAGGRARTTAS